MKKLLIAAAVSSVFTTTLSLLLLGGLLQQNEANASQPARPETAAAGRASWIQSQSSEEPADATAIPADLEDEPSPSPPPVEVEVLDEPGPPLKMVRIPTGRVLARINDVELTLKDLLPLGQTKVGTEEVMTEDMYTSLLRETIEREAIFDAARKSGLELTEEQKVEQERVRDSILAQNGQEIHLNAVGTVQEQIDFEMRNAASQLLLTSLLAREGLSLPHVTDEAVEQSYQEHRAAYEDAFGAAAEHDQETWTKIDQEIRQELTPLVQAKYREDRRRFLDGLKAQAQITEFPLEDSILESP